MSRRLLSVFAAAVCLVLVAPPFAASQVSDYSYARVVRLSYIEGDVQVYRPEEDGWQAAVVNLPLAQGYVVSTGFGRAEIEFESGATARIAENTVLQFTELALSGGGRLTQLTLTNGIGSFYANLSRLDSFVVLTPHLQVTIPENARFRLDVDAQQTVVSVHKGDVDVETREGTRRLTKNQALRFLATDGSLLTARAPDFDSWDRWVSDREDIIHAGRNASLQYARAPFSYGMADLYRYGNWSYLSGYGYCWQPIGVPVNWSPYWNGQWIFARGVGWTWLSFEPWGWVPYHFGRWAFTGAGWAWIPGHFNTWHPGPVHWVQIGNRVGWVPRGPNDRPGQPPENLPGGAVVPTGPGGTLAPTPNERVDANVLTKVEILEDAPTRFDSFVRGRKFSAPVAGTPVNPPAGSTPAAPPRTPVATDDESPSPARSRQGGVGGRSTIIFDSEQRRFVNHPSAPRGADPEAQPSPVRPQETPERPSQATSPQPRSEQAPAVRIHRPEGIERDMPSRTEPRGRQERFSGSDESRTRMRSESPSPRSEGSSAPRGEISRPSQSPRPAMESRPTTESRPAAISGSQPAPRPQATPPPPPPQPKPEQRPPERPQKPDQPQN